MGSDTCSSSHSGSPPAKSQRPSTRVLSPRGRRAITCLLLTLTSLLSQPSHGQITFAKSLPGLPDILTALNRPALSLLTLGAAVQAGRQQRLCKEKAAGHRHVQISLADRKVINTCTKPTADTRVGFLFELTPPSPFSLSGALVAIRLTWFPRAFQGEIARRQRRGAESYLHSSARSCFLLALPGGACR